eukprot:gene7406-8660_t
MDDDLEFEGDDDEVPGDGDDLVLGEDGDPDTKVFSQTELHEMIRETQITIYRHTLDHPLPLDSEVKMAIYNHWKEDPEYYNTKKLSQLYHIHRSRIAAIIRYQQIYEKEVAAGNEVFDDLEQDIAELLGTRSEDDYLGGEEEDTDEFSFVEGKENELTRFDGKRPDPLHETPVKIPASFPEKPVYFRGPNLTKQKRKNLIFIDTSKDPFTNKSNPNPMMLISAIDGSLRTPSSEEKSKILDHIKNPRIRRDPEALLKRPLKYKSSVRSTQKDIPKQENEDDDHSMFEGGKKKTVAADN